MKHILNSRGRVNAPRRPGSHRPRLEVLEARLPLGRRFWARCSLGHWGNPTPHSSAGRGPARQSHGPICCWGLRRPFPSRWTSPWKGKENWLKISLPKRKSPGKAIPPQASPESWARMRLPQRWAHAMRGPGGTVAAASSSPFRYLQEIKDRLRPDLEPVHAVFLQTRK